MATNGNVSKPAWSLNSLEISLVLINSYQHIQSNNVVVVVVVVVVAAAAVVVAAVVLVCKSAYFTCT